VVCFFKKNGFFLTLDITEFTCLEKLPI